jgi:hypothetical protein
MRHPVLPFSPPRDLDDLMSRHGCLVDTIEVPFRLRPPPRGVSLTLRFGDAMTVDADGGRRLTVRMVVGVKGDAPIGGTRRWKIRKAFDSALPTRPRLALDLDLVIGGNVTPAYVRVHGRNCYRVLRGLLIDAVALLQEDGLADGEERGPKVGGVGLSAMVIDNIALGKTRVSGIRGPAGARDAAMHIKACQALAYEVIPDLARLAGSFVALIQNPRQAAAPICCKEPDQPALVSEPRTGEPRSGKLPHVQSTICLSEVSGCQTLPSTF